jgi:hypothetical protein
MCSLKRKASVAHSVVSPTAFWDPGLNTLGYIPETDEIAEDTIDPQAMERIDDDQSPMTPRIPPTHHRLYTENDSNVSSPAYNMVQADIEPPVESTQFNAEQPIVSTQNPIIDPFKSSTITTKLNQPTDPFLESIPVVVPSYSGNGLEVRAMCKTL